MKILWTLIMAAMFAGVVCAEAGDDESFSLKQMYKHTRNPAIHAKLDQIKQKEKELRGKEKQVPEIAELDAQMKDLDKQYNQKMKNLYEGNLSEEDRQLLKEEIVVLRMQQQRNRFERARIRQQHNAVFDQDDREMLSLKKELWELQGTSLRNAKLKSE